MQMLKILVITILQIWLSVQNRTINITAAVQNQFEIYFSYLSYLSTCDYQQQNIFLGSFRIQELNSPTFYSEIQYYSMTSYWTQIQNGLTIMALLPDIISSQYDGYILYNSKFNTDYLSRQLIVYTLIGNNLTFYQALPLISLHNLTIYLNITESKHIQLNNQSSLILQTCPSINSSNFAYLGYETFIFVCGGLQAGFMFSPGSDTADNVTILNFTEDVGLGNYSVCSNPVVYNEFQNQEERWNAIMISQASHKETSLYILIFDHENNNLTVLSVQTMEPQISLIINRIWGVQIKKQFDKWMDLFSAFNLSQFNGMFPGTIVSLFVSEHGNIFVESFDLQYGLNFLNVFNSQGQQYWNISYVGDIIYYGSKAIFIYNKLNYKVYFIQVERPIFTLNVQDQTNTTADTFTNFSIPIPCENGQQLLINYNILWTTLNYPSALIICKDNSPIVTTDVVFGFEVEDKYQVIGPDFELIVNAPPNIQVTIIESASISFQQDAIDIVSAQLYGNNYLAVIFITNSSVYSINSHLTKKTIAVQPCGFNNMKHAYKTGNNTYIIINTKNQTCQCSQDFNSCHLVNMQTVSNLLLSAPNPMNRGSDYLKFVGQMNWGYSWGLGMDGDANGVTIRKNLYGLVGNGYIVSILSNNTVLLVSIKPKIAFLDSVTIPCPTQNSTNGDIYTIEFYDPYVIVFCQGESTLYQFLIRKGLLVPQRQIPLYRFVTRSGRYTFFPAFSFVYIAVDPIINVYPRAMNCCVLRLDLIDFTVSVIEEIIRAQDIIAVTNYRTVDIALYRMLNNSNITYVIKAYFPNIWITLDQTNHTQIIDTQQIPIIFESSVYNFGASFKLQAIFNLTNINLNLTKLSAQPSLLSISDLKINLQPSQSDPTLLTNTTNYTLSDYLCGPVFESYFYRAMENMTNLQVVQNDVMMRTKLLGQIGVQFMQLINPAKFQVSNLTLNDLIIAVSAQTMYIYDKQLKNVQLFLIKQIPLPQKRCTYYLYTVVNETSATFIANCQGINYNYKSPLLTINYNLATSQLTTQYSEIKIPLNLRQMYTIVQNGMNTLVVGIIEGPMSAQTGQLYICELFVCSGLYVSTSDAFLLNYAAKTYNSDTNSSDNIYVIMSIDYQTIQVFLNPIPSQSKVVIKPNYTINYTQYIEQPYCNTLKILNISLQNSFNVISCTLYYYYVKIQFSSSSITILKKFARYSQCDLEDQFQPSVIFSDTDGLQMVLAQCRQNSYMLRLQQYQTINSSTPIIYTGYLQVFLTNGPLGPNCSTSSTSPIKIVPISTSMNYPVFITYSIFSQSKTRIYKFIYMQINGILIDNILQLQPSFTILYKPFTVDFQYPYINFHALNQYHTIVENIGTREIFSNTITYINIIVFVVFALSNFITFVCLICFLWQKKRGTRNSLLNLRQSLPMNTPIGMEDTIMEENTKSVKETGRERQISTMRKTNRPSQIQMFFIKRK